MNQSKGARTMMTIKYVNGRRVKVADEREARQKIRDEYPDAVYHDEWEPSSPGRERLLVWACEDDAGPLGLGDGGQNAVCEIVRGV